MKKYSLYFLIILIAIVFFTSFLDVKAQYYPTPGIDYPDYSTPPPIDSSGQNTPPENPSNVTPAATKTSTTGDGNYNLLQPLPCKDGEEGCVNGKLTSFNPAESGKLGEYLNFGIRLFIGLCAVAAVVMIVVGGIEYATSELSHSKTAAKDRIYNAIFGLLLALGSYTILYTVNPDLLKTDFDVGGGTLSSGGEQAINSYIEQNISNENVNIPFTAVENKKLEALGIQCRGGGSPALLSTAQSFMGKTSYSMDKRNQISGNILYTDCSSYVAQVYKCVGISSPGETTAQIFSSGNVSNVGSISTDGTSIDGIPLRVGDLVGWQAGNGGIKIGHVMMYIGNGLVIESTRRADGVKTESINSRYLKGKIKYVKRL